MRQREWNDFQSSSFFLRTERFCFDPPDPPYKGASDWDMQSYSGGQTPFETEVVYSCGQGRRFVGQGANGTESLYSEKKFRCEWDGSWSPKEEVKAACSGVQVEATLMAF